MTARVLVVDDVASNIRLLQARLMPEYFHVLTASNGKSALSFCEQGHCDIVLMDVMMPKMDGFTAVEKIKSEMKPAPLVMMLTAKGTEDDVMQGLVGGADDYITKPFAPRELIARVKVVLIKAGRKADLPD